jgi:hypothetical protein
MLEAKKAKATKVIPTPHTDRGYRLVRSNATLAVTVSLYGTWQGNFTMLR